MIGFFINKMLLKNSLLEGVTGGPYTKNCNGDGRKKWTTPFGSCSQIEINGNKYDAKEANNSCKQYFIEDTFGKEGIICDGDAKFVKGDWFSKDHYKCNDGGSDSKCIV